MVINLQPLPVLPSRPLIVAYTVEILPYSIRAKGFTIFNFTISPRSHLQPVRQPGRIITLGLEVLRKCSQFQLQFLISNHQFAY